MSQKSELIERSETNYIAKEKFRFLSFYFLAHNFIVFLEHFIKIFSHIPMMIVIIFLKSPGIFRIRVMSQPSMRSSLVYITLKRAMQYFIDVG